MTPLILRLPVPPSANRLWRLVPGRKRPVKSREYRTWLQHAGAEIIAQGLTMWHGGWQKFRVIPISQQVAVHIEIGRPDKRRRDLDNRIKPILDCLTHARVIQDDSLVEVIHIEWGSEPGVKVEIWPIAEVRPKLAVVT